MENLMIAKILIALIALLHVYFFVLEAFLWTKPKGLKVFSMNLDHAKKTKTLALNQAVYNLFLSAGLIYSLICTNPEVARAFSLFNLSCVVLAGIVGGLSVSKTIFFIQAVPAILALVFL